MNVAGKGLLELRFRNFARSSLSSMHGLILRLATLEFAAQSRFKQQHKAQEGASVYAMADLASKLTITLVLLLY